MAKKTIKNEAIAEEIKVVEEVKAELSEKEALRVERLEKMALLRTGCEKLATRYNKQILEADITEASKTEETITEKVKEYGALAKQVAYGKACDFEDVMNAAVTMMEYGVIGIKKSKPEGCTVELMEIVDRSRVFDLVALEKFSGKRIGADKKWYAYMQRFNYLLTLESIKDLGDSRREKVFEAYSMTDVARQIEAFKNGETDKNPLSTSQLTKALDLVVKACLGDKYKARNFDVKFLIAAFSKKSSKSRKSITLTSHKKFCELMVEVLNCIVTNGHYFVESKEFERN